MDIIKKKSDHMSQIFFEVRFQNLIDCHRFLRKKLF